MTLKEKALTLIGLERMTNRDQLLDELAALPGEALIEALEETRIPVAIDWLRCDDCKAAHGGACPLPEDQDIDEDHPCPTSMADWLEMPCTRERLLPEVGAP